MKIGKNSVVTLDYSIADTHGGLLDEGSEPIVYLHGGRGDYLMPKVEAALEGKTVGDSVDMTLMPEDAFGDYDESLVEIEDEKAFGQPIELGIQFSKEDGEDALAYEITQIEDGKVVLDANHPFAGIEIAFSCTVLRVREATENEIKAGMPL
jgi:FKBP-type peptidyl-prolyl cis-trans isomerase SlyD